MSNLRKKVLGNKFGLPLLGGSGGNAERRNQLRKNYTPLTWKDYFEKCEDVNVREHTTFRVYRRGSEGPLLVLLHGGGYCGLTWAGLAVEVTSLVHCQVAAVDLRGHGDTYTMDNEDLSAETLSTDVGNVIEALYPENPPPILLVGHSMGGAIAVHVAFRDLLPSLVGLAVIDVVEGTAMDALTSMQTFLRGRPNTFKTIENAIEWCLRSGQVRNAESARVSMPGQIKNTLTNKTATGELETTTSSVDHVEINNDTGKDSNKNSESEGSISHTPLKSVNSIAEADEDEEENQQSTRNLKSGGKTTPTKEFNTPESSTGQYTWRIDLAKSEKYWSGWFQGLSKMFLSCPVPKMLLLAGIDRLDKELTVGQMQGKFQMQVLPQCGHAVHEDVPDRVAEVLATFLVRQKLAKASNTFQPTFPAC